MGINTYPHNWYWLVDGLMEAGYKVKLVNTAAVKIYEGMKYAGDEHNARHYVVAVVCYDIYVKKLL